MLAPRLLALLAVSGLVAPLMHAQPAEEDIPIEYRIDRKNAFSMGVRIIGGADVKFGNLGTIPSTLAAIPGLDPTPVGRQYHDGAVGLDAPRDAEMDGDIVITTPGGRYVTFAPILDDEGNPILDENGNPVTQISGDYLAYNPIATRNWSYSNALQAATPGFIDFHEYSSVASGAGATASSDAGPGFELAATHRFGRIGKMEWGIMVSGGLTDINGKTRGRIRADLITRTDRYSIISYSGNPNAQAPDAPYNGPSFEDFVGEYPPDEPTVFPGSKETTVPISAVPLSSDTSTTIGGAEVDGFWQIKGAYYMFRIGPTIRFPIGERFAVSASGGYAGAYVGTKYRVDESLNAPTVAEGTLRFEGEETYSKYLSGAYGELNVEFWLTHRTGCFVGATFETLGSYKQTLGSRTAEIDIGGNTGFRFGISTRF